MLSKMSSKPKLKSLKPIMGHNIFQNVWGNISMPMGLYPSHGVLTYPNKINRMSSHTLVFETPMSMLKKFFLLVSHIFPPLQQRFLASLPLFITIHTKSKLDPKALKCVFVWYPQTQKGYKCFLSKSQKFCVIMDITFFGNQTY